METNGTMNEEYRSFVQNAEEGDRLISQVDEHSEQIRRELREQNEQYLKMQAESERNSDSYMKKKLQDSKKTFGDSKLMKAVKAGIAKVDDDNLKLGAENYTEEDFNRILDDYFEAIESCRKYLEDRDSSSGKGLERRRLVEHNYNRLIREAELVSLAEELKGTGLILLAEDNSITLSTLLLRARVYDLGSGREERNAVPKEYIGGAAGPLTAKLYSLISPIDKKIKDKKKMLAHGKDVGILRRALKDIASGKASSSYVGLGDAIFILSQDENGVLTLKSGKERMVLKETVSDLMRRIDSKMIEESFIMPKDDLADMIREQRDYDVVVRDDAYIKEKNIGDIQKAGTRLARFLELRTGKPATFFSNVDAQNLRMLSMQLVLGTSTSEIIKTVENIEKERSFEMKRVNTSETLELLRTASKREAEVEQKVTLVPRQMEDDGWTEEERATRDFVADLIFSQDTWEADESIAKPGERIRRMLLAHKEIVATLIADNYRADKTKPSILDGVIDKLPLDKIGQNGDDLKNELKRQVIGINQLIDSEIDKYSDNLRDFKDDETVESVKDFAHSKTEEIKRDKKKIINLMDIALNPLIKEQSDALYKQLEGIEERIDNLIRNYSEQIQDKITESVSAVFRPAEDDSVEELDYLHEDPNEKGITSEEKKRRIELGEKELKKTLTDSMQGESGQGKFIKIVFENYFKSVDGIDKRSMFGSAIRNAKANATKGQFIGGLLKGAGPLFQKMMQGLPVDGMPPEIQTALGDMKSKLAPIPERIVKAQLYGIVERSKGKIVRIELTRALGAASVGQAFMCKLYGPDYPQEGIDVVVKLLKPDVRNRMIREKSVMLECARMTDETGGMEATYLGQLSRIEEELNLTIEGRNIQKGAVYDKVREGAESDGVSSTKLVEVVDTTVNSLVMVKGPSTTVDRFIEDAKERVATIRQSLKKLEDEKLPKEVKKPIRDNYKTKEDYQEALNEYNAYVKVLNERNRKYRNRILAYHSEYIDKLRAAIKTQKCLTELADKWVSEGIFGEGFYHGDLHAGNILTDGNEITVIDFGNATSLNDDQQVQVTRMVGAAAVGDVDGFKEGLHSLLKPEFEGQFKRQEKKLTREIKTIFGLGDKNSAGVRIAVLLLKAQELGLEVPSSIFNFSQCQLRLQNTIDEMNSCIEDMKKGFNEIDHAYLGAYAYDKNLIDEILEHYGSFFIQQDESGNQFIRRHVDDDFMELMGQLSAVDRRLKDEIISSGELRKRFSTPDPDPDKLKEYYNQGLDMIFRLYNSSVEKGKDKKDIITYNKEMWKATIKDALSTISKRCDIEGIAADVADYIEGIIMREGNGNIPSDADKKYLAQVEQKIDWIVQKYRTVKDSCEKLERDKTDSPDNEELLKNDIEQIQRDYSDFFIAEAVYQSEGDSSLRKLINKLADPLRSEENGDMINSMASYDKELGQKLKEDYKVLRTYMDSEPGKMVTGSAEVDAVIIDIVKITHKMVGGIPVAYGEFADNSPRTFVDVMGDTILRNLTESLKRLGFFTSIKYGKKLNEE